MTQMFSTPPANRLSVLLMVIILGTGTSAMAIDPEPKPAPDSIPVPATGSAFIPGPPISPQPSSADSTGQDTASVPKPFCDGGVKATLAPVFKKFGTIRYDRRIVTLLDPVSALIHCCIDEYGKVTGADITRSTSIPLLDEIALKACFRHQIEPGKVIDEDVKTAAYIRATFKTGNESKKLFGRYEVGDLEFTFMSLDTSLPTLAPPPKDSLASDSLHLADADTVRTKTHATALDSARAAKHPLLADAGNKGKHPAPVKGVGPKEKSAATKTKTIPKSASKEQGIPDIDAVIAVDVLATMTRAEKAIYPKEEARNRVEGTVWIASLIDEKGKARTHKVWKTSGNGKFDQAALQAAATSKYSPARLGKAAVMSWLKHKYEFRLDDR